MNDKQMIGFAGVIVATMSTQLNAQLSEIALADIAGHLGMSHDATTWFTSLYTSAEVVGMALAPWFAVTLTLRRFTLFTIGVACFSTILIPWSGNLHWLFSLRVVQGLCGGLTVPLLMTTALRVLAPSVLQQAQAELDGAKAALQAQQEQLPVLQAERVAAQGQVLTDQAALKQARLNLSYGRIVAPLDDVIGQRTVQVGDYVAPGTPLMSVVPLEDVYVDANYREVEQIAK